MKLLIIIIVWLLFVAFFLLFNYRAHKKNLK